MQGEEIKSQRKFTISELMARDNMVLETINDFDVDVDEDEEYGCIRNRNITSQEMLQYLNIEDDADEAIDGANSDREKIAPSGMSFERLKASMTDISGDGKVFKLVKQVGVGDVVPREAMVTIHYMGYFEYQDEPFDSSYLRLNPQRIRLNRGSLVPGLDLGISTMKKHEIAQFIIHPDYAYGPLGCPPRVPANEEVMFAVHLIDYLDNAGADTYENLDQEERRSLAIALPKAEAISLTAKDDVSRKRLHQAVRGYNKVIAILDGIRLENQEEQDIQQKAFTKALINLAICHNKLKEPRKACTACRHVPIPDAKASFTHGMALMSMGEYDDAMREMNKAKELSPGNYSIIKKIKELNQKMMEYKQNEKQLWSKCLSVRKEDKGTTEFASYAKKICENLLMNEDLMRQNIKSGLSDKELDCFREQAAALGLNFTENQRYGKIEYYICKPNYENHRR